MSSFQDKLAEADLTKRQAECLAMWYFDCFTEREIAERLEIKQQVVNQHLQAGLKKLKKRGLPPRRSVEDAPIKIINMSSYQLDQLGPSDIRQVW